MPFAWPPYSPNNLIHVRPIPDSEWARIRSEVEALEEMESRLWSNHPLGALMPMLSRASGAA